MLRLARVSNERPRADRTAVHDGSRARAMIDGSFMALLATDLRGVVTEWNRAAERLFGWRASEIVGRGVELIIPEDRREELSAIMAAIARGDEISPIDSVRRARDGRTIPVHMQMSPLVDDDGDVVGASAFFFENASHVRMRAALSSSEERYRTLVNALTEVVLVTDGAGLVGSPQPSWCAYTGQSSDAAAGYGWRDAMHATDRDRLDRVWSECTAAQQPFTLRGRVLHYETADYRRCEFRFAPVLDHMGATVEWIGAIRDVHDRHVAEQREHQVAERFRHINDANVFGVCYGTRRTIIDANDAMLAMLGVTRADLADGISLDRFLSSGTVAGRLPFGNGEAAEYEIARPDGSAGYVLAASFDLEPDSGWLAVAVDVTERKQFEREIEHRALHDALTGLPNRRLLMDRLEHALTRAARQETSVGVLFVDLDHFKETNDRYGHAAGDLVLEEVAKRLHSLVRESDTVARTGGDEFVLVLDDITTNDDALAIAERVRMAVGQPISYDGQRINVTCSIGISLSFGEDESVEELYSFADDAMYAAKRSGRDRVQLGQTQVVHGQRRWAERALDHALTQGELSIAFQPVIDLRDGRPVAAEALLRWQVDGTHVPTARLIAVAEDAGMMLRISDWVLDTACHEFSEWRGANTGAASWKLHINVAAGDLADEAFVDRVLHAVGQNGLEPPDICLEITETAMLAHPQAANERLEQLRAAGARVAIDDFGIGYASLGMLRDVPADIVKIDRSFVEALHRSPRDRAIVEHAIQLAHELGLVVVGEGVETLAQMSILDELGCDRAQGFAFALPRPVEELTLTL